MSFVQNMLGNATQADKSQYEPIINPVLVEGEIVEFAYKILRDLIIFTNERLIIVNVQGLTGTKKSVQSIPYSTISVFQKESAGSLDINTEIVLYVRELGPIKLTFGRNSDIDSVYQILSTKILKVT